MDQTNAAIGRFDKSFLIHMIKDFFIVLLFVTVVEFALKAALVWWDFRSNGQQKAQTAAEELAENVRSIMVNDGGPVAATTVYPILNKNWTELGYAIAIVPSEVTVSSIRQTFDYTPAGIPAAFASGTHREARIDIQANQVCLSCHTDARVGEVLGTVIVRDYLAKDFAIWLMDVRLTAGIAVGKIVLHSVLLFLILRARMEPLLRLRSVVSNLARAYSGLHHRAEVRTADEFGALARDLNLFLDRIGRLVGELDQVLDRVVAVNGDIVAIQGDLRARIDGVVTNARRLERDAMLSAKREPRLSNAWFDAVKRAIADLDAALASVPNAPQADDLLENLRSVVVNAEAQIENSEKVYESLAELGDDTEELKGAMAEMTRLEERMHSIIEAGTHLVRRLRPQGAPGAAE